MLKRILVLASLALFVFVTVNQAQMRMNPAERAKQLAEQLKLNEKQTKQVETIYTNSQKKAQEIMGDGGFGDPSNRDKMMKVREESNKEIEKILTDSQKKEFKKVLEEQRKRMEERRQNRMN